MALRNQPYFPLYVQDYLTDEKLSMCSLEAQGVYIKILCLLHKQEQYGSILFKQKFKQSTKQNTGKCFGFACQFARLLPIQVEKINECLEELVEEGVLKVEGDIMFQKRMVKDGQTSESRSKAGKKGGGNPFLFKQTSKQKDKQNPEDENENENENENLRINKNGKKSKHKLDYHFHKDKFMPLWEKWKEFKKSEFQFKYKSHISEQAAITELHNISNGDINKARQIIEQSIINGWKGFFEIKQQKNGTNKGTSTAISRRKPTTKYVSFNVG